jgi:hypothetical protein
LIATDQKTAACKKQHHEQGPQSTPLKPQTLDGIQHQRLLRLFPTKATDRKTGVLLHIRAVNEGSVLPLILQMSSSEPLLQLYY